MTQGLHSWDEEGNMENYPAFKWYVILKKFEGMPKGYHIGGRIALYRDRHDRLLYHVWETMISDIPEDCVKPE